MQFYRLVGPAHAAPGLGIARAGVFLRCSWSWRWCEVRGVALGERLVLGGCCGTFVV